MKKYLVEFIGTFFLVLTVVCTVNSDFGGAFQPIAIGGMLMVMIYAGGHISGAHFNPAVTLGVFLRGKCAASDVPGYMIAQILAGAAAAFIGGSILGKVPANAAVDMNMMQGGLAEVLGTFALVWVVLQTATTKSNEGNSFYGLAIGFTVTASAYALGGFGSGGCFNPAVAVGTIVNGLNTGGNVGVIVIANFVAGALAAFTFKAVYTSQGDDD